MVSCIDEGQALQVLGFLDPKSACRVREASQTAVFAKVAGSEALWSALLSRVFDLSGEAARLGPQGEAVPEARAAFARWFGVAQDCGLGGFCNALRAAALPAPWLAAWRRLRLWQAAQDAGAARTLRPPAEPAALALLAEFASPGEVHPLVTGLWQIHDGQRLPKQLRRGIGLEGPAGDEEGREASRFGGIFGGYHVYDHVVCTMLLPIDAAVNLTDSIRGQLPAMKDDTKIAFACDPAFSKFLFVDVRDGMVYVWDRKAEPPGFVPAVPQSYTPISEEDAREGSKVRLFQLKARPDLNGRSGALGAYDEAKGRWQVVLDDGFGTHLLKRENLAPLGAAADGSDGLLRWFNEFCRRLEEGIYERRPLVPEGPDTRGLCLLPAAGAEVSRCVTRGVEVTASCVYMPEHQGQGWGYSIALRLVGTAAERGFETCQLHTRIWEITEDGQEPQIVNGEGVIGLFPILTDGGWLCNRQSDPHGQYGDRGGLIEGEFRYQSCSGGFRRRMRGTFGGHLRFVPGTRKKPAGQPFDARLAEFSLYIPEYIF